MPDTLTAAPPMTSDEVALGLRDDGFSELIIRHVLDQLPLQHFEARFVAYFQRSYCDFCSATGPVNHSNMCESCFPQRARSRYLSLCRQAASSEQARLDQIEYMRRLAIEERRKRRSAQAEVKRNGRKFGVELEVNIDADSYDIAVALMDAGVECIDDGYTHEVMNVWKVVPDGSVDCGWEVVSPPMTMARARREVPIVTETLSNMGAVASSDCGLHVHHDVQDLTVPAFKRLVHRWNTAQPTIDGLVARHRKSDRCQWAQAFDSASLSAINRINSLSELRGCYLDRYTSLNVSCFQKYGTVEVRQFQSTLDADEILAWVELGQAFIDDAIRARTLNRGIVAAPTTDALVKALPIRTPAMREKLSAMAATPARSAPEPVGRYRDDEYDEYDDPIEYDEYGDRIW